MSFAALKTKNNNNNNNNRESIENGHTFRSRLGSSLKSTAAIVNAYSMFDI